jgi:small-conductance mechanosensitive channel
VIGALISGYTTRTIIRPRLFSIIDKFNLSFRANRILKNLTKLTLPITALAIVSIGAAVLTAFESDISPYLLTSVSKLLVAWIFIRVVAQIITNSFTRQIVATFAWLAAAISILGIMPQTTNTLDALGMDFGDFRLSVLTIIKFAFAFFVLLTITRLLFNTAERSLTSASDLSPSARVLILKVIKVVLIALAILFGVTAAGIDISALAIFGGALGLGIGFGLQKVISNLFSGMLLLIDKSIKPGDVLELPEGNGAFGWVSQLGARYVSIITRDNKEYLIPNEDFITQPVINWSYTDRKIRVETKFGVDYASNPHEIKAMAIEVATKVKRVVQDPKPVCHLVEFGDSSLNFVLRYWIEDAENGVTNTKGDVMLGLWDAFNENGVEIPFPHRVIIEKNKK